MLLLGKTQKKHLWDLTPMVSDLPPPQPIYLDLVINVRCSSIKRLVATIKSYMVPFRAPLYVI